jgi:hypothetical protein
LKQGCLDPPRSRRDEFAPFSSWTVMSLREAILLTVATAAAMAAIAQTT